MDIGAEEIWVDVGNKDGEGVRRFGTFTADLNEMAEWLKQCGIETVAMESTGVYWIAPFQILEAKGIEVYLVNARFVKNVQGRKTDTLDCQWIRLLHSYGLLPKSFRPAAQIAVLRSYLRHRQMLIQYGASHIQHMQKALTQMNVQIHHVISDITGSTGMRIIRAIVEGKRDPKQLAAMRDARTKATEATIARALEGDYRVEHVFALKQSLELFDSYQKQIQVCDEQIGAHMGTMETKADPVELKAARKEKKKRRNQATLNIREEAFRISGADLTQIDGISESAALALIAEIGVDMSPWKTEKQFASWLALSPNNKISGGKILKRSTRKTANRARDLLRLCAQGLMNSKSALGAYCRRMCGRLGQPKGIVATAHKLALLIYRLMALGRDYVDIGQEAYEKQYKERALKRLARKAKEFGMQLVPA
ncbi:MAG: IS110 family transposase [Candidatus Eremiobacteraeota bacterium]|nr:IS110 family transposase [Candidatus Eremiobacteraeota bacterium]